MGDGRYQVTEHGAKSSLVMKKSCPMNLYFYGSGELWN